MITGLGAFVGGQFQRDSEMWQFTFEVPPQSALAGGHLAQLAEWSRAAAPTDFGVLLVDSATGPERAALESAFGLDPLQMEDIANPRQRAKIEIGDTNVLCLLKSAVWDASTAEIHVFQVSVLTGHGVAIVFRDRGPTDVTAALRRLTTHRALASQGPGAVIYAVMDLVVDSYVVLTDVIQSAVEDVETGVFNPHRQDSTARIYQLNRQNLEFRRAVHPLVPLAHDLSQRSLHAVPSGLRNEFADVGDHILRVADSLDGFNNILLSMLMASTALQDLQQNRDVRKISAWVAIAAVPTAIAAIYGMNFDYMPELHWVFGYPLVLAIMASACTLLWRAFKRSGWL